MLRFFILASCLMLASCASAPSGSQETVRFISNPAGATMTSSTGFSCVTPCETRMKRDEEFTALFEKPGYQSVSVIVGTKINNFEKSYDFGPVSFGVESMTVAGDERGLYNTEHTPNPVTAELAPLK